MGKLKLSSKEFLLDCVLILVVLQIARIGIKNLLLAILNFSVININLANIVAIIIVGVSLFLFLKGNNLFNPAGYRLSVLSNRYDNKNIRIVMGALAVLSIIFAVVFKSDRIIDNIVVMFLTSLVIPVYEEFLFREYLWNYLNGFIEDERITWVVIGIIAMIFTFGYWDIASQMIEVTSSYKYTIDIMLSSMKFVVLTTLASGFMKYKYKDIYLCVFAHIIINSIFF